MEIELKIILTFVVTVILKISCVKIFKIFDRKYDYLLFTTTYFIFFIFFLQNHTIEINLYSFFLYCICTASFFFLLISPLDGSPSLEILNNIYFNNYKNKKLIYEKFIKKKIIENRITILKAKKYLKVNKNKILYTKKNFIIFKIFYYIKNIQKKIYNG
jgi:hypothetical protein